MYTRLPGIHQHGKSMTTPDDLILEEQGPIFTVRINRSSTRNALLPGTCRDMATAINAAAANPKIRCIVIGSSRTAFCAGADLVAASAELAQRPHAEIIRNDFHGLIRAIVNAPKPVVASIRGPAVGFGFDLALACDIRIASRESRFGAVFSQIGLVPDGGSSFTLSRLVGLSRAMELAILGNTFSAARAREIGLLHNLVSDYALEASTKALSDKLAAGPPLAYKLIKENFLKGLNGTLEEALERELEAQVQCLGSEDMMEGVQAFLEKRKPEFKGK